MQFQHNSLTSFTDMNDDSPESLLMDQLEDMTTIKVASKQKENARKGTMKKRKRTSSSPPCINTNNEEPQTTSASTAPIKHSDRRTSRETLPPIVEKPTKRKRCDEDYVNKETFDAINEHITECKYSSNHQRMELSDLKEEDNNNFLNEGQIMFGITCSSCKKPFVKNNKGPTDNKMVTVFNTKRTALCCNELLTSGPVVCRFCICYDCKCKMHDNDENESKGRSKRRSRRMN